MQIALKDIWIARAERQRRDIQVDDLLESIPLRGVLVPIIVTPEVGPAGQPYKLIAGERRLTACTRLGHADIPARILSDQSQLDQRVIELEENLRRKDLGWQDQCLALNTIHELLTAQHDGEWSFTATGKSLGYDPSWLQKCCRVAKELHRESIRGMESVARAASFIAREDERTGADVASAIETEAMEAAAGAFDAPAGTDPLADLLAAPKPPAPPAPVKSARLPSPVLPADASILQQSFLEWAPAYAGQPFNLIHCDFPPSMPDQSRESLIACLCANLDRLMAHSGHLMFWLPADWRDHTATLRLFAALAPALAFDTAPLVWLKSDHAVQSPDPKRQPRHTYETALIASREDRPLLKSVPDAISAPANKDLHPHTKPEPVLKHFFQMFVDRGTRLLDPTCGSGSALRAAEALGAEHTLGLEIHDDYVQNARRALNHSRVLRAAAIAQKEKEPSK